MKNLFQKFGCLFLGLVTEKNNGGSSFSLGRLTFVAVIIEFFILWHSNVATAPAGLMEVFYVLSGYVFGTKAIDVMKNIRNLNHNTAETSSVEEEIDSISQLPKG